jgi:hypothetical protein
MAFATVLSKRDKKDKRVAELHATPAGGSNDTETNLVNPDTASIETVQASIKEMFSSIIDERELEVLCTDHFKRLQEQPVDDRAPDAGEQLYDVVNQLIAAIFYLMKHSPVDSPVPRDIQGTSPVPFIDSGHSACSAPDNVRTYTEALRSSERGTAGVVDTYPATRIRRQANVQVTPNTIFKDDIIAERVVCDADRTGASTTFYLANTGSCAVERDLQAGMDDEAVDAVYCVIQCEYPDLCILRSDVVRALCTSNLDVDAAIRILTAQLPGSVEAVTGDLCSPDSTRSTQDAMIDMVVDFLSTDGVVGSGKKRDHTYSRSEIRKVLRTCAYDVDETLNILLNSKSKAQLNSNLQRLQRGEIKILPFSLRRVSDKSSFASITKMNGCSTSIPSFDKEDTPTVRNNKSIGPVASQYSPVAAEADSVAAFIENTFPAKFFEKLIDDHTEDEWREIARSERTEMIANFKRACQIGSARTYPQAALASVVGERGLEHKAKYIFAQRMVELHVFNRLNRGMCLIELNTQKDSCGEHQLYVSLRSPARNVKPSSSAIKIDLHLLSVSFAESAVETIIEYFRTRSQGGGGADSIVFVVGRGNHSRNGVPRIKPAVVSKLQHMSLRYTVLEGEILVHHV